MQQAKNLRPPLQRDSPRLASKCATLRWTSERSRQNQKFENAAGQELRHLDRTLAGKDGQGRLNEARTAAPSVQETWKKRWK